MAVEAAHLLDLIRIGQGIAEIALQRGDGDWRVFYEGMTSLSRIFDELEAEVQPLTGA